MPAPHRPAERADQSAGYPGLPPPRVPHSYHLRHVRLTMPPSADPAGKGLACDRVDSRPAEASAPAAAPRDDAKMAPASSKNDQKPTKGRQRDGQPPQTQPRKRKHALAPAACPAADEEPGSPALLITATAAERLWSPSLWLGRHPEPRCEQGGPATV